jgi:UBX domain-containing protein 1
VTLGGDGSESRVIPDPRGPTAAAVARNRSAADEEPQRRVLHIWADGFSIDDGELRRFDDPENAMDLQMIRQGRAPLHLMNVRYDQPVDVKLEQHEEDWRQLPKIYRPFGGEGRRLGSPVPGDGSSTAGGTGGSITLPPIAATHTSSSRPAAAAASGTGLTFDPTGAADPSQPTLTLRIQMPDGSRQTTRWNAAQALDDVYTWIQMTSEPTRSRIWTLATTFPNKEHQDRTQKLGAIPEFKKGATAVVKFL